MCKSIKTYMIENKIKTTYQSCKQHIAKKLGQGQEKTGKL